MSDSVEDVKVSLKIPTFDGAKENWPFFKKRIKSHLSQAGCGSVMHLDDSHVDDVPEGCSSVR